MRCAEKIVSTLQRTLESDEYDPLYSSRSRNLACWIVRANGKQEKKLAARQLIQCVDCSNNRERATQRFHTTLTGVMYCMLYVCDRSVTAIPRELKVHPSVLKLFSRPKSTRKSSRDAGVLKVEFGLGTGHGMHGTDIWGAVSSWLERYASPDA